jgi:DNA polymerase
MFRAEGMGLPIIGHSHDELITEVPDTKEFETAVEMLEASMEADIDWAPGLPLAAEGWEGERYEKQ